MVEIRKNKDLLSISEVADFLGVSINTLRLWDASGKLKAYRSAGGHRYYHREQIELFSQDLFSLAKVWAGSAQVPDISPDYYCETRDVFKVRLDKMAILLDKENSTKDLASLIIAVAGEIGNNSFDHNIGNWPDVPGIFFAHDLNKRIMVLADRGVGIRATINKVRADANNDMTALKLAFMEKISGRWPEQRGNGLKFVRGVALEHSIKIFLQSGIAVTEIERAAPFKVTIADRNIRGVISKINY